MGTVDLTKDVVNIVLVPIHDQFLVSRSYLICICICIYLFLVVAALEQLINKYSILATRKLWM